MVKHHLARWWAIYLLFGLLLVVGVLSYRAIMRSQADAEQFGSHDLPLFEQIQELRAEFMAMQSTVYIYYLTADQQEFHPRYQRRLAQIGILLAQLQQQIPTAAKLQQLQQLKQELTAASERFHVVMMSEVIDWDRAYTMLSEFTQLIERANYQSEELTRWVRQHISERLTESQQRLQTTVWFEAGLAGLTLLIAMALLRSHFLKLQALRDMGRLASFPKRNPHPVLALNRFGEVIYANPAAYRLVVGSGASDEPEKSRLAALLPTHLRQHLSPRYQEWEYQHQGRDYHIGLNWFDGSEEYHAYITDITARKIAERDLEFQAYYNSLSGLPNRHHFAKRLGEWMAKPLSHPLVVALIDIDRLHRVATVAGQSVRERVVVEVTRRIQQSLSQYPTLQPWLAHLDSDLFALIVPAASEPVAPLFQDLQQQVAQVIQMEGFEFFLSLTLGAVALEPNHPACPACAEEVLRRADTALSQGKLRGGNQQIWYAEQMELEHRHRIKLESGLRHAIVRGELMVYYQPKARLTDGVMVGAEALLRWWRDDKPISPAEFIPIAEESGQIVTIGEWVLQQACEAAVAWNRQRTEPISVAVNLSARQLLHGDIVNRVAAVVAATGMRPALLELEITESAALTDIETTLAKLEALRQLGIKLSLDDFGTGYSSLSYLHRLPVQTLKIDQSFTRYLTLDPAKMAITESIIRMAHQLDLSVVAEGVETEAQRQQLQQWQCDQMQGYLLSRPVPLAEFMGLCS